MATRARLSEPVLLLRSPGRRRKVSCDIPGKLTNAVPGRNERSVMMLVRIPSAWDGVDGSNAIQHKDI